MNKYELLSKKKPDELTREDIIMSDSYQYAYQEAYQCAYKESYQYAYKEAYQKEAESVFRMIMEHGEGDRVLKAYAAAVGISEKRVAEIVSEVRHAHKGLSTRALLTKLQAMD